MKRDISLTLVIRETRGWPYYKVRVLGPRVPALVGEVEVPVKLTFDTVLFSQRTDIVKLEVPTPEAAALTLESNP